MQASLARWAGDAASSVSKHEAYRNSISKALGEGPHGVRPVELRGWIKHIRKQKEFSFVDLHDGSNHQGIQAVVPTKVLQEGVDKTMKHGLGTGASIAITGRLLSKKHGRGAEEGEVELHAHTIELLGSCDGYVYPIQAKNHTAPFLRRNAHLRGRTSVIGSMLRLRSLMTNACYDYYRHQGFYNVSVPLITSSDCEGAGEVFSVTHRGKPFYNKPAYLTVSGQLHLEAMAIGASLSKVWHLSPAWRAEKSDTNRHLNEFWMAEAELTFIESLEDVMSVVEGMIKHIAKSLHTQASVEMQQVYPEGLEQVSALVDKSDPWKRITYADAIQELKEAAAVDGSLFQHEPTWETGLKSEHERWVAAKYGPTFVTDYPSSQKPFYMRINKAAEKQDRTVACFDLLVPRIGELAGGSLREERLDVLETTMQEKGMNLREYDWYLDLRRYGSVKHGGFGLGWERLISWLLGVDNVRECIAFPRGSEGTRF